MRKQVIMSKNIEKPQWLQNAKSRENEMIAYITFKK